MESQKSRDFLHEYIISHSLQGKSVGIAYTRFVYLKIKKKIVPVRDIFGTLQENYCAIIYPMFSRLCQGDNKP